MLIFAWSIAAVGKTHDSFGKVLTGEANFDKVLPADWLEDVLQINASSPLIGLQKGQLKL